MLVEFFCARDAAPGLEAWRTVCIAWGGLLLITGHAVYKAWLAVAFTNFYKVFYDLMQNAASTASTGTHEEQHAALDAIYSQLLVFAQLAIPASAIHPIARWLQSRYALSWRLALIRSYVARWDAAGVAIEGASQRVQEDTDRFADGLETAFSTLLDVIFTLVIFTPKLYELGDVVQAPHILANRQDWLVLLALALAVFGTLVGLLVARKLVGLEIQNQVVEAKFRMDLSLWEANTIPIQPPTRSQTHTQTLEEGPPLGINEIPTGVNAINRIAQHAHNRHLLHVNYTNLYKHFAFFHAWTGCFDQLISIMPYILAAPQLVLSDSISELASGDTIDMMSGASIAVPLTLGQVVELSRVFDRVFGALTTPMNAWGSINEFRSVLFRLSQFEKHLPPSRRSRDQPRTTEMTVAAIVEHSNDSEIMGDVAVTAEVPTFR